ncbi:hypothetical protein niasHT_022268 [Heterodera trifolii]|uniref:Uncharacterized protein n=1 Tax=Heterodera trifolii TaxID=157864 RepID=A0ABD2KAY8_9BILA
MFPRVFGFAVHEFSIHSDQLRARISTFCFPGFGTFFAYPGFTDFGTFFAYPGFTDFGTFFAYPGFTDFGTFFAYPGFTDFGTFFAYPGFTDFGTFFAYPGFPGFGTFFAYPGFTDFGTFFAYPGFTDFGTFFAYPGFTDFGTFFAYPGFPGFGTFFAYPGFTDFGPFFAFPFYSFSFPFSWYVVTVLLVGCGTILWLFWDHVKKGRRTPKKEIFISADCWLEVFNLLPTSQLGLGIALISGRFDRRVDEHFKTRKWIFGNELFIQKKKRLFGFGSKKMEIINANWKRLPIPQNPLPNKVIGFKRITIVYFDHNVLTFVRRLHRFFASSATYFGILSENVGISEFVLSTIWPIFGDSIHLLYMSNFTFGQMRKLVPSILNDCPSLRIFNPIGGDILPEFPPDDSANATNGQAVVKWLLTPRPGGVPKVLKYTKHTSANAWPSIIEQFKAAFSIASSRAGFTVFFKIPPFSSIDFVVPSLLTNALTGEQLALLQYDGEDFMLTRCPIAQDEREQKWNELLMDDEWNKIYISIGKDGIDNDLLDASSPGPSGQQQK